MKKRKWKEEPDLYWISSDGWTVIEGPTSGRWWVLRPGPRRKLLADEEGKPRWWNTYQEAMAAIEMEDQDDE